jgi:plasmid stabilization system protein ParE
VARRVAQFHPEAIAEARAAAQWYRVRNESAADAFLSEPDRAVEEISQNPQTWPLYAAGTRRFLLKRFPFSVIYRELSGHIEVVAVAHGRRKPGYWKTRLV